MSLDSIKDLDDTIQFLTYVLPNIGFPREIDSAYNDNFKEKKSKFSGFFLNERKYFVGDFVRFKFKFATANKAFVTLQEKLVEKLN